MAEIPDSESIDPLSSPSYDSDADYQPQFLYQHNPNHDPSSSVRASSPLPAHHRNSEPPDDDIDAEDLIDFLVGDGNYYEHERDLDYDYHYGLHHNHDHNHDHAHDLDHDHDEELTDVSSERGGQAPFHMSDDGLLDDEFEEEGLFVDDFDEVLDEPANHLSPDNDRQENVHGIWRALNPEHQHHQHRHHNHNGLPPLQFRMDPFGRPDRQRDELVQMEMGPQGSGRNQRQNRQQQQPTVIDLTGEDADSSPRPAILQPPRHPSQNARRRRSQQRSTPPRLARSDGSYIGGPPVINLVSDSDDELAEVPRPRRGNNSSNSSINNNNNNNNNNGHNNAGRGVRNIRFGDMPRYPGRAGAQNAALRDAMNAPLQHFHQIIANIPIFHMMGRNNGADRNPDDDIVMLGQRHLQIPANPPPAHANLGPVHLDYVAVPFGPAHGGGAAGSPKPAHEPPKEAREGFTRDTGEEVVAICPSCEQELAYDPDGDDDAPTTPVKKQRTKKDKAEHHFWAVKACGHVYCKKCFDNRKPVGKHPVPVGFRPDPKGTKNKMLCAVDECESDVSSKSTWVGIYL